jgi:hypothetical protein
MTDTVIVVQSRLFEDAPLHLIAAVPPSGSSR